MTNTKIFPERIKVPNPSFFSENYFWTTRRLAAATLASLIFLVGAGIPHGRALLDATQIEELVASDNKFQELSERLTAEKNNLHEVNSVVTDTMSDLQEIRSEKASLADSLAALEQITLENQEEMSLLKKNIDAKKNTIMAREKQLKAIEQEIWGLKNILKKYARSLNNAGGQSTLEMLLQSDTFAEALAETRNLELVEKEAEQVFARVRDLHQKIDSEKREIAVAVQKMELMYKETERRQNEIALAKAARQTLLQLTENDEERFQKLLLMAKNRQVALGKKVDNLTSRWVLERQEIIEELKAQEQHLREIGQSNSFGWPVSPKRGISAYFHDAGYKKYFGVPHQAIDIRAKQGTDILAPAYGYVYKTYQNGLDYAYILIAHSDSTFTLYGHVNKILVQEGDMVQKGQVIGKVGGMPGTIGAGMMTTGSHLHFEVHKNGHKIDPLSVLPLAEMNENEVPAKYKNKK